MDEEQKSNLKTISIIFLVIILIAFFNIHTKRIETYKSNIKTLENKVSSLEIKRDLLEEEKNNLQEENDKLYKEIKTLDKTIEAINRKSTKTTKKKTKSVTVYVTNTGSKYHKSWCSYLNQSKIPITLKKAKAQGYTPCSRCY